MAVQLAPHVPRMASDEGVIDAAKKALGDALIDAQRHVGEITLDRRPRGDRRRAAARCAIRRASNISS